MFDPMFIPPREHPLVMRFASVLLPVLGHAVSGVRGVDVSDEDMARLRELGPGRAILTPNHPTGGDPVVMFWLSRMLGQPFNYLAAREAITGIRGWLMRRIGVYSVIRGMPDRESLRTTRRLLAEQDRKVVIFPEGEIYEHNDVLLAFQSGVAQIGFWVLDDLEKAGKPLSMPVVPIAIKYRCCDSPRPAIEGGLHALEQALDLPAAPKLTAYQRLRRVGDAVLCALEADAGLKPEPGGEFPGRIRTVRQRIMERVARAVGVEIDERQTPADQLHLLYHELKRWAGLLPDDATDYDERLHRRRLRFAAPLFHDLERLQNFIALSGDYVASQPTAERFLEVLGRLEKEVLGEVRHAVPREGMVRIAPPIRLEEQYAAYRANKRGTVAEVTRRMEETIRGMLQELSARGTPISLDA